MTEPTTSPTVTMQTFTPRVLGLGPLQPEEIRLEGGSEVGLNTFILVARNLINILSCDEPISARLMFQPDETPEDVVIFTGDIVSFDDHWAIRFTDGVLVDLPALSMQLVAVSI
jgi:hypothetical protein